MRRGCIFLTLLVFIYCTQTVQAATPSPGAGVSITFSEVSACEENEWVELYNSSDQDINLTGWKIEKKGEGSSTWSSKPVDSTIATLSAKVYKKTSVGSSFLSNSGFSLRLKDAAGDVVDENVFGKCPSGETSTSWIKDGEDWKLTTQLTPDSANTLVAVSSPTPSPSATPTSTKTPAPSPSPTPRTPGPESTVSSTPVMQPTGISLSEIYACQGDNEKEWVELYNSANTSATLTDWKLVDDDKNDQPIAPLTLPSNGYGVVEISKYSKGMLTNSGDVVNLIDGVGKTVDSFSYKSCTKGKTWQKGNGVWQENTTITKGSANPVVKAMTPTPQPEGDGGDIRVASALGAEEASSSGFVLGTEDEAIPPAQSTPTPSPITVKNTSPNWLAYGSIATGIVIVLATAGYLGFQKLKTKKT